jgi:hypothetical protein
MRTEQITLKRKNMEDHPGAEIAIACNINQIVPEITW